GIEQESKSRPRRNRGRLLIDHHEEVSVLGRPGSDLLFQVLRLSTIGAGEFYGRVRDGIGYRLPASTTRPAKDRVAENRSVRRRPPHKLVLQHQFPYQELLDPGTS